MHSASGYQSVVGGGRLGGHTTQLKLGLDQFAGIGQISGKLLNNCAVFDQPSSKRYKSKFFSANR